MSDAAFDRLLEFALREVLREQVPVAPSCEPRPASFGGLVRHRPAVVLTAAAALAVVAAVAVWPTRREATADRDLLIAAATDPFRAGRTVPFGAVGWNHDANVVALRSPDGAPLRLMRGAALQFGDRLELLCGEIELLPAAATRVVRVGDGRIEAPPQSHVFVRSTPLVLSETEELPMKLSDLLARSSRLPVSLSITVLLGSADLVDAQERTRVDAGETRVVQKPENARRDAARATTLFVAINRDLPEPSDENAARERRAMDAQCAELGVSLLRSPAAVAAVKNDLLAALTSDGVPDARRGRLLQLANFVEEPALLDAIEALVAKQPTAFGSEHWIALAARGNPTAQQEVHRLLEGTSGARAARAIAALVAGGDTSRRAELRQFFAGSMDEAMDDVRKFDARCFAALALARSGARSPLEVLVKELAATVRGRLDSPESIATSADRVRRALYFLGQPEPRLDNVEVRLRAFPVAAFGAAVDAAAVEAALADLEVRVAAIGAAAKR